jgi:hypothetical protein
VNLILKRLEGSQVPVRIGREVGVRKALAVVTMLVDDADTARRLCEKSQDAVFEKRKTSSAVRLAAAEEDDGSTGLVELGVEPLIRGERPTMNGKKGEGGGRDEKRRRGDG